MNPSKIWSKDSRRPCSPRWQWLYSWHATSCIRVSKIMGENTLIAPTTCSCTHIWFDYHIIDRSWLIIEVQNHKICSNFLSELRGCAKHCREHDYQLPVVRIEVRERKIYRTKLYPSVSSINHQYCSIKCCFRCKRGKKGLKNPSFLPPPLIKRHHQREDEETPCDYEREKDSMRRRERPERDSNAGPKLPETKC